MVVVSRLQLELHEDAAHVRFDRLGAQMESRADGRIGSALCHQVEYLAFALGQLLDGVPVAASSNELRNYIWVDDSASGCDPSHGIAEFGDVANVILQ